MKKIGILGAGMMGEGIACVSAVAGIEVVLKDVSLEAAEKEKAYSANLFDKKIVRGRANECSAIGRLLRLSGNELRRDL